MGYRKEYHSIFYFSIDRNEFRNWISENGALQTSSSFESSGSLRNNNIIDQAGLSGYEGGSQNTFESSSGLNSTFARATGTSEQNSAATIQTSNIQQTNQYLSQTGTNLFNDPNPQIIRRAATEGPVTYQQKILVRFLQPPPIPPPGVIDGIFIVKNLSMF